MPSDPKAALSQRFGEDWTVTAALPTMATRGSCRQFTDTPVPPETARLLCALALSSPSKSDLQQRDIILLTDPVQRARVAALAEGQDWVAEAPNLAVFCGNNRRQRQMHARHDVPFANDHLDALFNAAVDVGIALSAFVTAAEAMGLGCCPVSGLRNRVRELAALLALPDHVFPVAGLAFGYPAAAPKISARLPLSVTLHENTFREEALDTQITAYDARRKAAEDFQTPRFPDLFPHSPTYSWSEDKCRQYSQPERADFGAYLREIGFDLS